MKVDAFWVIFRIVLPNFLGLGAQRAGTTTLFAILRQHPEIYLPEIKETGFFCDEVQYRQGRKFYENTYFARWRGEKAVGEISPDYLLVDFVPQRIYELLGPEVRLVVMLRNPADRAWSNYLMNKARGVESLPFEEALRQEERRIKESFSAFLNFSYLGRGYYARQIKRYCRYFSRKNMFFIIFETDFLQNRGRTIKELLRFLGVDSSVDLNLGVFANPYWRPRSKILSSLLYKRPAFLRALARALIPSAWYRLKLWHFLDRLNRQCAPSPSIDPAVKQRVLERYFLKEIRALEKLIGRDLSVWLKV